MIINLKNKLSRILSEDILVTSFSELREPSDIDSMVNKDTVKAVFFSLEPVKLNSNLQFIYKLDLYVVDISNDEQDILSTTLDSSLAVIRNIYSRFDETFDDVNIETEYVRESNNSNIGVMVKSTIMLCYGIQ